MDITTSLLVAAALLIANGFFVAAEFALVKARGFRLQALAVDGNRSAALTVRIHANLEPYLAACQLGITMASLGLGWVGEPAVAALLEPMFERMGMPEPMLHTTAFIIGFLIFSSLHIVVGEQVPKTLAIRQAEPVSVALAWPLHICYLAVLPLNWVLNKATAAILSAFGVAEATHGDVLTSEELQGLVGVSGAHGTIRADKASMLHNLFDFDDRLVGRVMIPRNSAHVLDLAADPETNLAVLRDTGHSRFPVLDSNSNEAVAGILLAKDVQQALLSGAEAPWLDLRPWCRAPLVVPETQTVGTLFRQMQQERSHMALVVDEYGAFQGVVTMEDLLEEIVGEIEDESDDHNTHLPGVTEVSPGHWRADGLMSLPDLERATGLVVPADVDANTLSGLCMVRLGRMPEAGDEVQEPGHRILVLSVADLRVAEAEIFASPAVSSPQPAADQSPAD